LQALSIVCRINRDQAVTLEDRTARLTILIDPRKKSLFERLCAQEDATPSQVVRRLIRRYIEEKTGQPWVPASAEEVAKPPTGGGAERRGGRPSKRRAVRQP
jgi:Ribbon-helix-helix protein